MSGIGVGKTRGLSKPAADMSRGATAESILGVAAIIGLQAIEYHTVYRDL